MRRKANGAAPVEDEVASAVAWLKRHSTKRTRDGMARYAIPSDNALGVPMRTMQQLAKRLGKNHEVAAALWETGWYETRTVAAFVDEPELVTPAQMDRWCRDFDNWAICDTVCFHLFNRSPHALRKVEQWSRRKDEFVRRAAFALLACVALRNKGDGDEPPYRDYLPLIERAATDGRNFVKKGVSWALRAIGGRSLELNAAAVELAERLSESADAASRWVGKHALRDITRPAVTRRLVARSRPTRS